MLAGFPQERGRGRDGGILDHEVGVGEVRLVVPFQDIANRKLAKLLYCRLEDRGRAKIRDGDPRAARREEPRRRKPPAVDSQPHDGDPHPGERRQVNLQRGTPACPSRSGTTSTLTPCHASYQLRGILSFSSR